MKRSSILFLTSIGLFATAPSQAQVTGDGGPSWSQQLDRYTENLKAKLAEANSGLDSFKTKVEAKAQHSEAEVRAHLGLGMLGFCLNLGLETIEAAVGLGELGFQIFGVPVELLAPAGAAIARDLRLRWGCCEQTDAREKQDTAAFHGAPDYLDCADLAS